MTLSTCAKSSAIKARADEEVEEFADKTDDLKLAGL
jgi:hypothetical protein